MDEEIGLEDEEDKSHLTADFHKASVMKSSQNASTHNNIANDENASTPIVNMETHIKCSPLNLIVSNDGSSNQQSGGS